MGGEISNMQDAPSWILDDYDKLTVKQIRKIINNFSSKYGFRQPYLDQKKFDDLFFSIWRNRTSAHFHAFVKHGDGYSIGALEVFSVCMLLNGRVSRTLEEKLDDLMCLHRLQFGNLPDEDEYLGLLDTDRKISFAEIYSLLEITTLGLSKLCGTYWIPSEDCVGRIANEITGGYYGDTTLSAIKLRLLGNSAAVEFLKKFCIVADVSKLSLNLKKKVHEMHMKFLSLKSSHSDQVISFDCYSCSLTFSRTHIFLLK